MRNRIIALALVFVFVAAFSAASFAQANPKGKAPEKTPIVIIAEKSINLGDVLEGQDYTHTFIVKNGGTAELQILSVKPG